MNWHIPFSNVPPWMQMWGIAITLFFAFKAAVLRASFPVSQWGWRQIFFFCAWPGMNADDFCRESDCDAFFPTSSEWGFATVKMLFGFLLISGISQQLVTIDRYMAGWVGMIGIVFSLHFGLFHLLSCFWRSRGVNAPPIMNWPVNSQSLSEFWGQRWNLGFRDLTYQFLFRPLVKTMGPMLSLITAFFASGLIHDLVISVPAKGGFGYPTVYFVLQGLGVLIERSHRGRILGIGRGWTGRIFCATVLVAPCGLLFHRPFVNDVIVPFLEAIGSLK